MKCNEKERLKKNNFTTDLRIDKIFNEYYEAKINNEPVTLKELHKKYGYSDKSAQVHKAVQTVRWRELVESINDEKILKKLEDIALDAKKDSDAIRAIQELIKLKGGRYPDENKPNKNVFQTQINNLLSEEKEDKDVIEIEQDEN